MARWRAEPVVSVCSPDPAPEPAEGEEQGPDAGASFLAELSAAGVNARAPENSLCQRGDDNLARIALAQ